MEFDTGNNSGKYKVETIWDNAIYAKKSESGHLPGFYYLVSWKRYLGEENTWEPASAIQYLRKLISSFYKDYPSKLTAISITINIALLIAEPIVKPTKSPK